MSVVFRGPWWSRERQHLVQPVRSGKVFQRCVTGLILKGKSELANLTKAQDYHHLWMTRVVTWVSLRQPQLLILAKMMYIWLLKTRFFTIADLCHKALNLSQEWTLVHIWGEGKTVMLHVSYGLLALTVFWAKDLRKRAEGKLVLMNSWLNTDYWNDILCNIWTWTLFSVTDWENSSGVNFNSVLLISHHLK